MFSVFIVLLRMAHGGSIVIKARMPCDETIHNQTSFTANFIVKSHIQSLFLLLD